MMKLFLVLALMLVATTANANETQFEKNQTIYKGLYQDGRNYVRNEAKLVKSGDDYRGQCFSKNNPDQPIGMILSVRKIQKEWRADFIYNRSATQPVTKDWIDVAWEAEDTGYSLNRYPQGGLVMGKHSKFETRIVKDFSSGYLYAHQARSFDLSELICWFGEKL